MDLNNDGKIDETELRIYDRKQNSIHFGRSFILVIIAMIIITGLTLLDKGSECYMALVALCGVYAGRSIGNDITNANIKNDRREQ